ncbi:hypothetical protein F5882DRAFT_165376 [Hyaloscypha sp. PMI_1271]|nr:hypothetical protein F5882DRAFT_165376 [Hyaloscypha sp. PMI_1271]
MTKTYDRLYRTSQPSYQARTTTHDRPHDAPQAFQRRPNSKVDLWLQHQRQSRARPIGRVRKTRTILPITIGNHTFDAIPDSGSEENIMTVQVASQLGLTIEDNEQHQKEFRIANGKVVKSLGRVQAMCAFAKDQGVALVTAFYVFRTMVSDLIIGMDFLDVTETMTKHKHRFDKKVFPLQGIPQISALNNPRRRLRCLASGQIMLANADTGAEMNLVSVNYVESRRLVLDKLSSGETQVQLADGSIVYLAGKVYLTVHLDLTHHGTIYDPREVFYVMEGLTCSLLFGEDALEGLDAFETYRDNLVLEPLEDDMIGQPEACTILWFDTLEKFLTPKNQRSTIAPPPLSAEEEDTGAAQPLSERAMKRVRKFLCGTKEPTEESSNDSGKSHQGHPRMKVTSSC